MVKLLGKKYSRTLCLVACALALSAHAGGDTFVFFESDSSCALKIVVSEPQQGVAIYDQWAARARSLPTSGDSRWGVYYMSDKQSDFAHIGMCKREYEPKGSPLGLVCHSESFGNFPLAGARFEIIRNGSALASFRCVSKCLVGVPKIIHDQGDEPGENVKNSLYEASLEAHQRMCKKRGTPIG